MIPKLNDIGSVMIVEDNPTDLLLLKQAFKRANYGGKLEEADSADEAYRKLLARIDEQSGLPDLILLDLGLPGESGMEMLKKLKAHPPLAGMHVVVYSGSQNSEDMAKARALGARWYFVKQSSSRELDFVLQELAHICSA